MSEPKLQPLRILAGWQVNWHTLMELDPTPENFQAHAACFSGSSLFLATNEVRRSNVDVEWRPEYDPNGRYVLTVQYVPWPRTPNGKRRKGVPLDFADAEVVHKFETTSREELVNELEDVFLRVLDWQETN